MTDLSRLDVVGLVLAAGAGRRMGKPKALLTGEDGTPWVTSAIRVVRDGGCGEVLVAIGAQAQDVRTALGSEPVDIVRVPDWHLGASASLKAGLAALLASQAQACLVHLVDLPDVSPAVVARVLAAAGSSDLCRASYGGRPGHPVLIGRRHWTPLMAELGGDSGANRYLRDRGVVAIECSDLATGHDVDRPV